MRIPGLRPAVLVALALGAPALTAAVTVTLECPDRVECPAGQWLDIPVKVTGAPAGQPVQWLLWKNGVPAAAEPTSPVRFMPGGGVTFLAPRADAWTVFSIQALCAGVHSAPKHIVVPGAAAAGEAPFGAKRTRTYWSGAAAAPGAPAPPPPASLLGLPAALKGTVAEFAGDCVKDLQHLKGVNKEFWNVARRAIRRVRVKAETDAGLHNVIRIHPGLRELTIDAGFSITPEGLKFALNQNKSITSIHAPYVDGVNADLLRGLATTHPRLTRLAVPAKALTEEVLGAFADRLEHLEVMCLAGPTPFPERALARCLQLKTLKVSGVDTFTAEHLPPQLERLSLFNCAGYTAERMPAACLTHLSIDRCPAVTAERIEAMAHHNPLLVSLDLDVPVREAALIGFAGRLHELVLRNGSGIDRGDFRDFTQLATLAINNGPLLSGKRFPASLRKLVLANCLQFRSDDLASLPLLDRLEVYSCPLFTGEGIEGPLTHLWVYGCKGCTLPRFRSLFTGLEQLRTLGFYYWGGKSELEPGEFVAHPRLRKATTQRLKASRPIVWTRPAAPSAP